MSRVTSLRKKRLQHKLDREKSKANHACKRARNSRPITQAKNWGKRTPKRRAAA